MCAKFYPNYPFDNQYRTLGPGNFSGTYTGISYGGKEPVNIEDLYEKPTGIAFDAVENLATANKQEDISMRESQTISPSGFNWLPFGGWTCLAGYGFSGSVSFGGNVID